MQVLYNSDHFAVMQIDVPDAGAVADAPARGGFEIVDKFSRKEIFIEGALAQQFQEGVEALIEQEPSEEELDDFIERYANMGQQPVVMH